MREGIGHQGICTGTCWCRSGVASARERRMGKWKGSESIQPRDVNLSSDVILAPTFLTLRGLIRLDMPEEKLAALFLGP